MMRQRAGLMLFGKGDSNKQIITLHNFNQDLKNCNTVDTLQLLANKIPLLVKQCVSDSTVHLIVHIIARLANKQAEAGQFECALISLQYGLHVSPHNYGLRQIFSELQWLIDPHSSNGADSAKSERLRKQLEKMRVLENRIKVINAELRQDNYDNTDEMIELEDELKRLRVKLSY